MMVGITGGTGFIGRRLAAHLVASGHRVKVLTRSTTRDLSRVDGVQYIAGDLTGQSDLSAFVHGVEVLFHCAGEISDPTRMEALHVRGTERLIAAASGHVARWVQLSSTGAYGARREGQVGEDAPPRPLGPYETTKVMSDERVAQAAARGDFSATILRPSIVFGATMPNQSLFAMLRMVERRLFFFIGRPGASANYIHVHNVVRGLEACGFHPLAAGQVFNLSDHRTMESFVGSMAEGLGVPSPIWRLPEQPVRLAARGLEKLPGWPLKLSRIDALTSFVRYPTAKIEHLLAYQHSISMEEGIAELVQAHRRRAA